MGKPQVVDWNSPRVLRLLRSDRTHAHVAKLLGCSIAPVMQRRKAMGIDGTHRRQTWGPSGVDKPIVEEKLLLSSIVNGVTCAIHRVVYDDKVFRWRLSVYAADGVKQRHFTSRGEAVAALAELGG